MAYTESHWEEVAKYYNAATVHPTELTGAKKVSTVKTAKVQNHYPYVTHNTVALWIRRCREKGLITEE